MNSGNFLSGLSLSFTTDKDGNGVIQLQVGKDSMEKLNEISNLLFEKAKFAALAEKNLAEAQNILAEKNKKWAEANLLKAEQAYKKQQKEE